jgi:hypothetical protein
MISISLACRFTHLGNHIEYWDLYIIWLLILVLVSPMSDVYEGFVKARNGSLGKSSMHSKSFSLSRDPIHLAIL